MRPRGSYAAQKTPRRARDAVGDGGDGTGLAAFGAMASSAFAFGTSDSYSVKISPTSAPAGKSTTFDVALSNGSSSRSALTSAAITPPLGFRMTHASLPSTASGKVYVIFNIVVLDRVNVAPGSTL